MDRDAAVPIALALLAVLALGVAAATIDTAVVADGEGGLGGGGGSGSGVGPDEADRPLASDGPASATQVEPLFDCVPALRELPALVGLLVLFGVFFGLTYRDTGSAFASFVVAGALFIPISLVWYLFAFCREGAATDQLALGLGQGRNGSIVPEGGGATGLGGTAESVSAPTAVFTLLLVAALLASLVLLVTAGGDDEESAPPADLPDEPDDPDVVALGEAAGAAADRIQDDADVDNEVFRAWREMTDHLDVREPASSTPAEFADAAVDAGMDREHVSELTTLFEEVRYGGAAVTEERERRAVEALRRIEDTYGGDRG